MSSSSPSSSIGAIDLESVLNVRRRTLVSIGESSFLPVQQRHTDMVYVKREDRSNSLFSFKSEIVIFGELQFLCNIFERYTSNISVYEESIESSSTKTSFSTAFEENEDVEGEDTDILPIVPTLREISISSQSSSPPPIAPDSPIRRRKLSSIGRLHTGVSTTNDYSISNLEGKRYGCIQLPNMTIIEILEILFRHGLDLVNESSDYNEENVFHQNFVLLHTRPTSHRVGHSLYSRSSSSIGT